MRRVIFLFMLGVLSAALLSAAVSVYLLHDIDKDMLSSLNQAFAALCTEAVIFTMIVGCGVAALTFLARLLFHLKGYSPSSKLGFALGVGVPLLQYPWDYIGRLLVPKLADLSLGVYLIVAVLVCSIVLIRSMFSQRRLREIGQG